MNPMIEEKIAVVSVDKIVYPSNASLFRPGRPYAEYLWKNEISEYENYVYDAVRNAFKELGLDKERYGTCEWNPLGDYIKTGNSVLIKPNMVMHNNLSGNGNECLYTHPSVVAAVIDYVVIALKGNGKIIVGDAPMQECNWNDLIENSGYSKLCEWYSSKGIDIQLVDFRGLVSEVEHGMYIQKINENTPGQIVRLNENSEFANLDNQIQKNMRITNYEPSELLKHHHDKTHEYCISQYLLDADVVIDMPKPKSHRKAGFTGALKNFVGVNIRKEYLPHHTQGAAEQHGDEYNKKSLMHLFQSHLVDKRNYYMFNNMKKKVHICNLAIKASGLFLNKSNYFEGSWWGNNTISKTIADINKIVCYASKTGELCEIPQRKILCVADMVIAGEKEGPVLPEPKEAGLIVAGDNLLCVDEVICTLMGFDVNKVPVLNCVRNVREYSISNNSIPFIVSNCAKYNKKRIGEIDKKDLLSFIPTNGWKGHIEL